MCFKHCCPVNFAELSTTLTLSERGNIYTIRDMSWDPLPETRCKYVHVRSNARPTTMDGGSADFAGAKICHAAYGPRQRIPVHASNS